MTEPEAPVEESYTCDLCNTEVGTDRVLTLRENDSQGGRHPDCHAFDKAMH